MLITITPGTCINPLQVAALRKIGHETLRIVMIGGEVIMTDFSYGPDADQAIEWLVDAANGKASDEASGTGDFAEVQPVSPKSQCAKDQWCEQRNGHEGPCNEGNLPF